jgi:hypothetical protein
MKTSESVKLISAALLKAHQRIKHASKDSKNPHFRNDYASLESVIDATKEELLKEEIVMLQGMSEDGNSLVTRLQHVSGEFYETYTKLVLSQQNMQGLGSAITYARRYAGAAINNISQADDDGNDASNRPARQTVTKKSKATLAEEDDF